ncbi:MAG: hypothetical protein ACI9UA_004002 [Pseudoalteromonas tetraodonis]
MIATRNILQQDLDAQLDNLVAGALFISNGSSVSAGVRHLVAASPGVDYGDTAGIMNDVTDMDGDGDIREPLPLDILGQPRSTDMPSAGAFQYINGVSTALSLSNASIEENRPATTRVAFLSTEDPNLGEFDYNLVAGAGDADNTAFAIDANRLTSAEEYDFEAKSSYQVRIRSTDISDGLGQFIEAPFIITILDSVDQTLTITATQPYAYEPHGGWQIGLPHIGRVRIERAGEVAAARSVALVVNSTVFGSDEKFLLQPEPPAVLEFAPGETVFEFEVLPLFDQDDANDGSPDQDQVRFALATSPLDYKLLSTSATVNIFDQPADAWLFAQQQSGSEADLFDYLFKDPAAAGGVVEPDFGIDPSVGLSATVAVDRLVLDYQLGVEVSGDLLGWMPAGVMPSIVSESISHQTLNYLITPDGNQRRFLRLTAEPKLRPDYFTLASPSISFAGIPAGGFHMGSTNAESGRGVDEGPVTNVQFSQPFWMSSTEITQAHYQALMGGNLGTDRPMVNVTFVQASQFATTLSTAERNAGRLPEGYLYRLPTEAEWEYACRAGTSTPHFFGNPAEIALHAWYVGNSLLNTRTVALKTPNAWGIYDTAGNVAEWCQDFYHPEHPGGIVFDPIASDPAPDRSIRGGHIYQPAEQQRSAFRLHAEPSFSSPLLGFRIVLAPAPAQ